MTAEHNVPPGLAEAVRDRYQLIRETGHGGSATVFLARDLKHDRFVALKVLNPDVGHTTGERFLREIQVSAGMQHPHILPTYDSGIAEGRLYFVMPFVDGGSLRQRLDAATALPVDEALRIAHDIAIALAHAHDLGVVHRDVKPENIMFYHGHACLADFGVARAIEQMDATITAHGTIVGTPAYMSPEQFASADFDGRSDVYSLACVLFEMIAGTRVFAGSTAKEVVRQRQRSAPSIRKLREQVPVVVDDLLTRALATMPEDRFTDAREFATAIEHALAALSEPERTAKPRRALASLRTRSRWAWGIGTFAAIAVAGIAVSPLRDVIARIPRGEQHIPATGFRPFDAGTMALAAWDLTTAQRSFSDAIAVDPDFAPAHLWNAQSQALARQAHTDEFRAVIMRLASVRERFSGRDSLLAAGLIALGERQFPRACEVYEELRSRDSLDVLAWYGLGDCHALDDVVLRDSGSPSGWYFRSSWHAAANAYMRAVELQPEAHSAVPYALVTRLLPTDAAYIRTGRTTRPEQLMLAHPSLASDTIAWIPFPAARFQSGRVAIARTHPDALRRNRQTLLDLARRWTAVAPANPDAHEALALAREAREELDSGVEGALGATRRALALATIPDQRVRLASAVVRLQIKRREFARARAIADSLLAAHAGLDAISGEIARRLAGLAALTGRPGAAAEYRLSWVLPHFADRDVAPPLAEAASRFFTHAAAGVCDDSLRGYRPRIERLLESHSQPSRRATVRAMAIGNAGALAYPCLGDAALQDIAPAGPLDRAQRAHASGNHRLARLILDSMQVVRNIARPGDVTLQDTYLEAHLRAASRDTAAAIRQLDLVLEALPTLGTLLVREEDQAAAVGRAMFLRAELALAAGDTTTARRWATNTLTLWSGAEPAFAETLARLRSLASP